MNRTVLHHDRPDLGSLLFAACPTNPTDAASVGQRRNAALEGLAADRIDHQVHTLTLGESHHLCGHVGVRVVDAVVQSVVAESIESVIA